MKHFGLQKSADLVSFFLSEIKSIEILAASRVKPQVIVTPDFDLADPFGKLSAASMITLKHLDLDQFDAVLRSVWEYLTPDGKYYFVPGIMLSTYHFRLGHFVMIERLVSEVSGSYWGNSDPKESHPEFEVFWSKFRKPEKELFVNWLYLVSAVANSQGRTGLEHEIRVSLERIDELTQ